MVLLMYLVATVQHRKSELLKGRLQPLGLSPDDAKLFEIGFYGSSKW